MWLNFSMIFVFAFGVPQALASLIPSGRTDVTTGQVTTITETSTEINEERVYAVNFTFNFDGQVHSGASYTTDPTFDPGESIDIEFSASNPDRATIQGLRRTVAPWWVGLLIMIFPIVGVAMVFARWRTGRRGIRLAREGRLAWGWLKSSSPTGTEINEVPVMKLVFEFDVDGRAYQAEGKTHDTALLEDEDEEPVLYDPRQPNNAMPLDLWANELVVKRDGQLAAAKLRTGVAVLWVVLHITMWTFWAFVISL